MDGDVRFGNVLGEATKKTDHPLNPPPTHPPIRSPLNVTDVAGDLLENGDCAHIQSWHFYCFANELLKSPFTQTLNVLGSTFMSAIFGGIKHTILSYTHFLFLFTAFLQIGQYLR